MDFKDYYAILGVPPDADEKAIKQAYRKLARQHHPDVNPGNPQSEEKFKAINEANQVLSDPEQRKKYDALRAQYLRWGQTGHRPQEFNWQDWATASGAPAGARPGQGPHVQYASEEDLFGGQSPYSDFFTTIFGQAGRRSPGSQGGRAQAARPRPGRDLEHETEIALEEAYQGATRNLQIGDRRIEARIPAGVRTGSRVRLAGQGEPGRNGGPPGDLYLVMRVLPHPSFEREGDDLYTEVPVDIYTAVLGGEVRVPTLERPVVLKIPPQTQAGRSFRLRGKGMPHIGAPNIGAPNTGGPSVGAADRRGDLYARVRLVLPEAMNEQEIQGFRQLAEAHRSRQAV